MVDEANFLYYHINMRNTKSPNRCQMHFFPETFEDYLPENHLAKFIVNTVAELDLTCIIRTYGKVGASPYDPEMMVALLFYAYTTGVFSSRKIEKGTYESIPIMYITGGLHPDHDTINDFRLRFLPEIKEIFKQILIIAKTIGLLTLGNISIDGTKIKADASKYKNIKYNKITEQEKRLKEEIKKLFEKAEEELRKDNQDVSSDKLLPEIENRREMLKKIEEAKASIEKQAKERYEQEKKEYDEKMQEREQKEKETGKKSRGKPPQKPKETPRDNECYNYTDNQSKIMKAGPSKHWEQAYNGQAAVDVEKKLIVGEDLSNHCNDKNELIPTLNSIPNELGKVKTTSGDAGYYSEENLKACEERNIEAYIPPGRTSSKTTMAELLGEKDDPVGENPTTKDKMDAKLKSEEGREIYSKRMSTSETVFGIIKEVMNFRQFSLRGLLKVKREWTLVCTSYNIKRLHKVILGKDNFVLANWGIR